MPKEWLGEAFLLEAEALKRTNERLYRHMYLGEVTGTGGQVFENLQLRSIKPEEWQGLRIYAGLDFGFASDPDAFVRCAYSRKRRVLYIVDEFIKTGQLPEALAKEVRKRAHDDVITCDSAEPRSIAELRSRGLRVIPAKKGPDSVEHGMKWLQTRIRIMIDPAKCPIAAKEFSAYEYDRDKAGNILPRYPDKDNHTIDAARYALESVSALRTAIVPR
jgi:PBSX family phage terminase large subunit